MYRGVVFSMLCNELRNPDSNAIARESSDLEVHVTVSVYIVITLIYSAEYES